MARTQPLVPKREPKPLPPPPDEPRVVDPSDLPMVMRMRIERIVGMRQSDWEARLDSDARLTVAIVAALYDADFDLVAEETERTLSRYVLLRGPSDGEDDGQGNG